MDYIGKQKSILYEFNIWEIFSSALKINHKACLCGLPYSEFNNPIFKLLEPNYFTWRCSYPLCNKVNLCKDSWLK
jgi:hypothetical protein